MLLLLLVGVIRLTMMRTGMLMVMITMNDREDGDDATVMIRSIVFVCFDELYHG